MMQTKQYQRKQSTGEKISDKEGERRGRAHGRNTDVGQMDKGSLGVSGSLVNCLW